MTHPLLDSVASTTARRDRDALDRALVCLLTDFLETEAITLLRVVSDGAVRRVEHRLRVSRQHGESGSVRTEESAQYPELVDFPAWEECVQRSQIAVRTSRHGRLTTAFPVRGERAVVGILAIETSKPLPPRETDLVRGVLGILRNHLSLLDYGELDALTGLLNRKTFEAYLDKLRRRMLQARALWEPSWLALIDIDRFKSINDRYGHLFGDEILLLVSSLMRRVFRSGEQLFRFGGEEFVVVIDHARSSDAQAAFERLRAAIEEYPFPQIGRVSISVGYTRITAQDVPAVCIERADAALYHELC
jgi:diguanylate cyclase (GGDEF)-like protein